MISINKLKRIKSLAQKKYRQKEQLFLVEGDKNVLEVLNSSIEVKELFGTSVFLADHKKTVEKAKKIYETNQREIKKASLLMQPQNCFALCAIPPANEIPLKLSGFSIYLDGIQDPGNLGTIIRTCDWFGVEYLFCSPDTADIYNPKVIQASMGSFCRVNVVYAEFEDVEKTAAASQVDIYGTTMNGNNLYSEKLSVKALVILGNEGKGIRLEILNRVGKHLKIPSFNNSSNGAESLNVAVAAGILCSEFRKPVSR